MAKKALHCKFDPETIAAARKQAAAESLPVNRWIENTLKRVLGILGRGAETKAKNKA